MSEMPKLYNDSLDKNAAELKKDKPIGPSPQMQWKAPVMFAANEQPSLFSEMQWKAPVMFAANEQPSPSPQMQWKVPMMLSREMQLPESSLGRAADRLHGIQPYMVRSDPHQSCAARRLYDLRYHSDPLETDVASLKTLLSKPLLTNLARIQMESDLTDLLRRSFVHMDAARPDGKKDAKALQHFVDVLSAYELVKGEPPATTQVSRGEILKAMTCDARLAKAALKLWLDGDTAPMVHLLERSQYDYDVHPSQLL